MKAFPRSFLASMLVFSMLISGCTMTLPPNNSTPTQAPEASMPIAVAMTKTQKQNAPLPADISIAVSDKLAGDFQLNELKNLQAVQDKWGAFSKEELAYLTQHKFLEKDIQDTKLVPRDVDVDTGREFLALYRPLTGSNSEYDRKPEDAIFWSSDVFFNAYGNLYRVLLKEMEDSKFAPAMKEVSKNFYEAAKKKEKTATVAADKKKWQDVRNYFALPYALLSSAAQPLEQFTKTVGKDGTVSYTRKWSENIQGQEKFTEQDPTADKKEVVVAFIKQLKLDTESTKKILADVDQVYKASGNDVPVIFKTEYDAYTEKTGTKFSIAWSLFTPRADYTGTSMRRQYFRAMQWYGQVPFFVQSPQLTTDAFAITQLMADDPAALKSYNDFEETINFMVGESDDLTPVDYLAGLQKTKDAPNKEQAIMDFLIHAKNPQINGMPESMPTVGEVSGDTLKLGTKGMRFFSGKFVIDSSWTDRLTQGDEAIQKGYTQKLPPLASSLQVMNLLGSNYAGEQIAKLDFYKPGTKDAIDQAMREITQQVQAMKRSEWEKNLYMGWLDVVQSLFTWQQTYSSKLPFFMQSDQWAAKTLMTGAAFWTELRHATLLYVKQSMAELGAGGPDECDKFLPQPPKGYIEPQYGAYTRLISLASNTEQKLKDHGYELINMPQLHNFINVMWKVMDYTKKELANTEMLEKITSETTPYDAVAQRKDGGKSYDDMGLDTNHDGKCTVEILNPLNRNDTKSSWETIRLAILDGLEKSLPMPLDGPVLAIKDKRVGIVADVHTGMDSSTPAQVIYEGVGVPRVIFVAVKDGNGPRLTTGIVYSQYEFRKDAAGQRMTDEDWQKQFYNDMGKYDAYKYTPKATWPKENAWYDILFSQSSLIKPVPVTKQPIDSTSNLDDQDPNIAIIEKYYSHITSKELEDAYNMKIDSTMNLQTFKKGYEIIEQIQTNDFKKLSHNRYQFKVDFIQRDGNLELYDVVMEVENDKVKTISSNQIMKEKRNEITFNPLLKAYVDWDNGTTKVIIVKNGQEKTINIIKRPDKTTRFDYFPQLQFSSKGDYLTYSVGGYEGSKIKIYDIKAEKEIYETFVSSGLYGFTDSEDNFFECGESGMFDGYFKVISVPTWKILKNIQKEFPSKLITYCGDYDKTTNSIQYTLVDNWKKENEIIYQYFFDTKKVEEVKKESVQQSFATQINQSLENGFTITEIDNPNLILPSDIHAGQIEKYFKIDNILFALVLQNSMNVDLPLPKNFSTSFVGVLVAKQGNKEWSKLLEIKDINLKLSSDPANNPYYLFIDNKKLFLTVVDQNGAGSGEGVMKVFAFSKTNEWKLSGCYYFGGSYNDPITDGDYFAFTTQLSKHKTLPIKKCAGVRLVVEK